MTKCHFSQASLVGRTFPHNHLNAKEKVALDKVLKIHRRLPSGGILVFLTGKQEIVRMINRLRGKLEKNDGTPVRLAADAAQVQGEAPSLRELDDEEVDGDLFQEMDGDDEDDFSNMDNDDLGIESAMAEDEDGRPKKVRILPLYSMLSPDEQARVFEPVPEDTRLIVCATNLAETSSESTYAFLCIQMELAKLCCLNNQLPYPESRMWSTVDGKSVATFTRGLVWHHTTYCGSARQPRINELVAQDEPVQATAIACTRRASIRVTSTSLPFRRF